MFGFWLIHLGNRDSRWSLDIFCEPFLFTVLDQQRVGTVGYLPGCLSSLVGCLFSIFRVSILLLVLYPCFAFAEGVDVEEA